MRPLLLAVAVAAAVAVVRAQPDIAQVSSDTAGNLIVQSSSSGDVTFRSGPTGPNATVTGLLTRLSQLEARIASIESNTQPTNISTVTYTSNLNPAYAASSGMSNDVTFLVGRFFTSQSLAITVEDNGPCAGFSMRFTIVARWGALNGNAPQVFSAGAADASRHSLVRWFFKGSDQGSYFLWLHMPPWPVCGLGGQTPGTHTLTVTTSVSSSRNGVSFDPPSPPAFNYYNGNASGITLLPTQIHASEDDIVPTVNNELGRAVLTWQWNSNMNAAYARQNREHNDLGVYLGRMSVNSVVSVSISDSGWCSGTAVEYKIMGRWGIHFNNYSSTRPNDDGRYTPVVYAVGQATGTFAGNNQVTDIFNLYFSPVGTNTGHLFNIFLYIPPFPVCGSTGPSGPGTVPRQHTTTVTMQVDGQTGQAVFNGTGSSFDGNIVPFDWFGVNSSNIIPLTPRVLDPAGSDFFNQAVNQAVNRNVKTFTWSSNMAPAWAQGNGYSNTLSGLIGEFSTASALDITVEDVGWCSGVAMNFLVVGRWGVHNVPNNPSSSQYHPEIFSFGSAAEWLFNPNNPGRQVFQFFFRPAINPSNGQLRPDRYYLYLYIPPFPVCGSPGNAPQTHTATVTTTVSRVPAAFGALTYDATFNPNASLVPQFNYFAGNSSNYTRIDAQLVGRL